MAKSYLKPVAVVSIAIVAVLVLGRERNQVAVRQIWERQYNGLSQVLGVPSADTCICLLKNGIVAIEGKTGELRWRSDRLYTQLLLDDAESVVLAYSKDRAQIDQISIEDGSVTGRVQTPPVESLLGQSRDGAYFATSGNGKEIVRFVDGDKQAEILVSAAEAVRELEVGNGRSQRLRYLGQGDQHLYLIICNQACRFDLTTGTLSKLGFSLSHSHMLDSHTNEVIVSNTRKELFKIPLKEKGKCTRFALLPHQPVAGYVLNDKSAAVYALGTGEKQPASFVHYDLTSATFNRVHWRSGEIADVVSVSDRRFATWNWDGWLAGWAIPVEK